jgi:hypothetical protein
MVILYLKYNMTSTNANGRLGNQIIRNLAVSLVAEKYNLKVDYFNKSLIEKLGIELFSGLNTYTSMKPLTDENYFSVYNSDKIDFNLYANNNFFQTKEITNFLYHYLHSDNIKSKIISNNPFKHLYSNNNDLFVHIRLTDAAQWNPGLNYYINAIKTINFDKLYISTDDEKHPMILKITQTYPSAKIIISDEITTFQFASTCKHILLSHGSFSAVIGYFSFFSDVYYPEYELDKIWYGDMFSITNWKKLNVR